MPAPKSILKPTMPPLREIPARNPSPRKTITANSSDNKTKRDQVAAQQTTGQETSPSANDTKEDAPPTETKVTLRTEEQQQKAAHDREEKEMKALEKDVNARREARRKSLANRRVSFAPESTLHTWEVVEYMQDSTTSSSSTSSSRRASSASNATPASPARSGNDVSGSDPSEPPSTPPEQIEEGTVESPAHQRDLHQKKRRRSSGIPPLNFNNPDDEFLSSSPYSGESGIDEEEILEDATDSDSDSDNEGTAMILDEGDTTNMSMTSQKSAASSTGSSAKLEEALRLAARQAGTQGIDFDENSAEEEEIASFTPWTRSDSRGVSSLQDQENVNPFSPAFRTVVAQSHNDDCDEMDMDMEMTQAVGRIMPPSHLEDDVTMDMTMAIGGILQSQGGNRRKSVSARRQSNRRRSSAAESADGDKAMDLTMAVGGIQEQVNNSGQAADSEHDEDMTMEFTSVIGGVLAPGRRISVVPKGCDTLDARRRSSQRLSMNSDNNGEAMDMTVAVGSILPSEQADQLSMKETDGEDTFSMDITTAIGRILPSGNQSKAKSHAKRLMEKEVDSSEPVSSPFQPDVDVLDPRLGPMTIASETGSPSMTAFRGKGLRHSGAGPRNSTTPKSSRKGEADGTPVKEPLTPAKQITPLPSNPKTPTGKTPPSSKVNMRSSSPKRLFAAEIAQSLNTPLLASASKSLASKSITPSKLFQKDATTGLATPSVILNHRRRRSSGVGIDKEGLGSPRIAAILDRRGSIGEKSQAFSPGQFNLMAPIVRFDEPREMEAEIDKEREEEAERENGRRIMEREADAGQKEEKDATLILKEMIQSLTPKKKSMKGRKSLHVGAGAARGILGKRSAELDNSDDEEDDSGVKRLKNHQGSPVKNVKLQAPPSKEETTGRLARTTRRSLEASSGNITTPTIASSPSKKSIVTTPRGQGRFKDVETPQSAWKAIPFNERQPMADPERIQTEKDEEPMHLQDFLNMTSIRFMELTTTKRRPTVAPKRHSGLGNIESTDTSLENCVAACACTIPMLELYQHVCLLSNNDVFRICANSDHSRAESSKSTSQKVVESFAKLSQKALRRTRHSFANIFLLHQMFELSWTTNSRMSKRTRD